MAASSVPEALSPKDTAASGLSEVKEVNFGTTLPQKISSNRDKKKKENVLSELPTLISTSTACCRLGFMISKTSCAGAGWWVTC